LTNFPLVFSNFWECAATGKRFNLKLFFSRIKFFSSTGRVSLLSLTSRNECNIGGILRMPMSLRSWWKRGKKMEIRQYGRYSSRNLDQECLILLSGTSSIIKCIRSFLIKFWIWILLILYKIFFTFFNCSVEFSIPHKIWFIPSVRFDCKIVSDSKKAQKIFYYIPLRKTALSWRFF